MTEQILEKQILSDMPSDLASRLDLFDRCISGEWQDLPLLDDYRAEQVGDLFVERATWAADLPELRLREKQLVLAARHVWFRFWVLSSGQVIEKCFDADGRSLGFFAPICMPIEQIEERLHARSLLLGLWIASDGRICVLNEAHFDRAVRDGRLTDAESAYAEQRIREVNRSISERRFPPALIRNFALDLPEAENDRNS